MANHLYRSLLNFISYRKIEQHNFKYMTGKNISSSLTGVFLSVSLLQAFLIGMGVTEVQLGTINIAINAAAIFGMLVTMGIVDRLENERLVKLLSLSGLPALVLPVILLVISILGGRLSATAVFLIAVACWAFYSLITSFRNVLEIKANRYLFSSSVYGTVFGVSGIIMYIIATGCSFGLKRLVDFQFGKISGYSLIFGLAALSIIGFSLFASRLKTFHSPEDDILEESTTKMSVLEIIKTSIRASRVRNLILLHICRGVVNAMVYFLVPIGMHFYGMSLSYAAYITLVTMLASFTGYIMVTFLYDRIGSMWSSLLGILLCFAGIIGLFFSHSPNFYLVGVFIFYTGHVLFCQCIPLGAYKVTPRNILGSMTVFRLILMQSVEALFTFLLGMYFTKISIYFLLGLETLSLVLQTILTTLAYKNIPSESRPKMKIPSK